MKKETTTDTQKQKTIMREFHKQLHANKTDNLKEIDKSLESHSLPRLNQEGIENINRTTTSTETPNKHKSWMDSQVNSITHLEKG